MKDCKHLELIMVEETPKGILDGEEIMQPSKTYVKCAKCKTILPICRITKEVIEIPLIIL